MTRTCPNCGDEASIDPLEAASAGTGWLHCGSCDHLWEEEASRSDVFSLIVGSQAAKARPHAGKRPAGGPHRALRFEVQLQARFRPVGETSCQRGTTVNISQSGMFLRVDRPVPGRIAVEVLLELPVGDGAAAHVNLVRCSGHTVRSVPPVRPGAYASVAIAIDSYRLDTGSA